MTSENKNNSDDTAEKKKIALQRYQSTSYLAGMHKTKKSSRASALSSEKIPLMDEEAKKQKRFFDPKNDLLQCKNLILGSKINLLLAFVPFGFISYYADWTSTVVFFINFLAMIPVANILGDSTECLSEHLGETIGGLLNATFGNAVEIVVMILALSKAKTFKEADKTDSSSKMLVVVQCSLIGSIFSNSLLVLGCSFLANGFYFKDCTFNTASTSANVCLLLVASFVMILPAPYSQGETADELMVSRAAAFILLGMYSCLLFFVLHTHKDIMDPESEQEMPKDVLLQRPKSKPNVINPTDNTNENESNRNKITSSLDRINDSAEQDQFNSKPSQLEVFEEKKDDDDDEEELSMSLVGSISLLLFSTILVSLLSEYLVDALEPMSEQLGMTEAFIGIILLPIIGNAVEHLTAIRMAMKNKMDIALSIAIGSATQVAMFVVPIAILIAWCMDLHLALDFDNFEVNMFIYTTIILFAITSDGHSNWLEGAMLIGLYLLIAVAVWDQKLDY